MGGLKSVNPVVIRADTSIGANGAEADDDFLFNCFLDHPSLSVIGDLENSKLFLSGRTGSGKTAILRMLKKSSEHTVEIDLHGMAMDYVANSDIIRFLISLGVDMDLMFQVLWKHVLCIEYIRLRFSVENKTKSSQVVQTLFDFFKGEDRWKSPLGYLKEWENKFWITMDENIREITENFEKKAHAEFSAEVQKFKASAGYIRSLSAEKRSQYVARAKQVIKPAQLADLNRVLDLLSGYDKGKKGASYYILIDRLDDRWVDESIRFSLIRALIESLKSFRKVRNLKVIVAMRTDVIERVILENDNVGFQREKYDDYFHRLVWDKEQLNELVQKRINFMYQRKYTQGNVFFEDVFSQKISNMNAFDYILDRTLYRPRDVISFVNLALQQAQGSIFVAPKHIKAAEGEYSRLRLQALESEWKSAIPSLGVVFKGLSGIKERFELSYLNSSKFLDDFVLRHEEAVMGAVDPFSSLVKSYINQPNTSENLVKAIAAELYRIGAIGIKLASNEPYRYSYSYNPILNQESISLDNKIHIHPMLHRALNIASKGA